MVPSRFHRATIALHWLGVVLLAATYACIELRVFFPKGSDPREALKAWHFALGIVVLAVTLLRVGVRLGHAAPPIVPAPPAWQQAAALAMHLALYGWLLAMPLAGWLLRSADGHAVMLMGLELPRLMAENKAFAKELKGWHELAGRLGYGLIALHLAASMWHHHMQHDNTLVRMLPGRA